MKEIVLTRSSFGAWLGSRDPRDCVGDSDSSDDNPVARYLREQGCKDIQVSDDAVHFMYDRIHCDWSLPEWIRHFLAILADPCIRDNLKDHPMGQYDGLTPVHAGWCLEVLLEADKVMYD